LSGSLRRPEELTLPPRSGQKVFVAHGRADAVVPAAWSQNVATVLDQHGYRPTLKLYPLMGHSITPALVTDFRSWLQSVLSVTVR
jgi:predicted esterase